MEDKEGRSGALTMSDGRVRMLYGNSQNEGFQGLVAAYCSILTNWRRNTTLLLTNYQCIVAA